MIVEKRKNVTVGTRKPKKKKGNSKWKKREGWNYTYNWAKPYFKNSINAIDVGCRGGEFARLLENDFTHIYCYDFRDLHLTFKNKMQNASKFTYTVCGIGDVNNSIAYTKSDKVGRIKGHGLYKVNMRTIDSFKLKDIGFIKYDIEGYELKALKGSEQTIKKYWPTIIIEQNRGDTLAQDLLESWGYKCMGVDQVFFQDYLMVKK